MSENDIPGMLQQLDALDEEYCRECEDPEIDALTSFQTHMEKKQAIISALTEQTGLIPAWTPNGWVLEREHVSLVIQDREELHRLLSEHGGAVRPWDFYPYEKDTPRHLIGQAYCADTTTIDFYGMTFLKTREIRHTLLGEE